MSSRRHYSTPVSRDGKKRRRSHGIEREGSRQRREHLPQAENAIARSELTCSMRRSRSRSGSMSRLKLRYDSLSGKRSAVHGRRDKLVSGSATGDDERVRSLPSKRQCSGHARKDVSVQPRKPDAPGAEPILVPWTHTFARAACRDDVDSSDAGTRSTDGSDRGSDLGSFIVDDDGEESDDYDERSSAESATSSFEDEGALQEDVASLVTESTLATEDMMTPPSCKKRRVRQPVRYTVDHFSDADDGDEDEDTHQSARGRV